MKSHIYFRGLKFVRFFAASLVVVHHIEQFKSIFGLNNYWSNGTVRNLGDKGVTLFFVLSGFLISYLLLMEKQETSTVKIKFFYLRRILKIWPLYFLILLVAVFIFPLLSFFRMDTTNVVDNNLFTIFLLGLVMLPNVILFKFGMIPFASQTWSIGVEEQFYLLWPILIKYIKRISLVLLFIIVAMFILQNSATILPKISKFTSDQLSNVSLFFRFLRIDCMAFGGIGALLYFNNSILLKIIYHPVISLIILLLIICILLLPFKIFLFDNIIQSLLFMCFILNIATNTNCFYSIETNLFNFLGDISYGIYMYHPVICFALVKTLGTQISGFMLYLVVFISTIIIAYMSYVLFEKKLIQIKTNRFTIIKSN